MTQYSESLSIQAVGDIMPGISSVKAIATDNTVPDRIRTNLDSVFKDIRLSLRNADLLLGTLECPLTNSFPYDEPGNTPFLLGPKRAAEALNDAGFDCLSVANNHILDHGEEQVKATLRILREHDLRFVGDPFNRVPEQEYKVKDRTIAVSGFNLCDQGPQNSREELFEFVERNSRADLTVLLVHWGWGYEHLDNPSLSQVGIGHDLIDAGADIVLGSHSHVFQPVERYNGGVIAYSLGNFLFDMWRQENRNSGILELVHGRTGSINVSITPVRTTNGAVTYSDHAVDQLIVQHSPNVPSSIDRDAKLANLRHTTEIVAHYLRYSASLSGAYHQENLKRWCQKLTSPREVFR